MRCIITALLGLALLGQAERGLAQEQEGAVPAVAVLPFTVDIEGQYAYLNDAIRQMLITRLSGYDDLRVVTVEQGTPDEQLSADDPGGALEDLGARWLVDGTVYSLKDGVQFNLSLVEAGDAGPRPFAIKADDPAAILAGVSELAAEIRRAIVPPDDSVAATVEEQPEAEGLAGFTTPHPERAYKKGLYGGGAVIAGDGEGRFESRGVRRSGSIPLAVESLVVGDLNGDGSSELVVASKSKIRLFTYEDVNFTVIAEYDFSPRMKIHAVNIGDPGDSGSNRLYVSANEGKFASSAILSWNGSKSLQSVRQGIRWYIRPVSIPGRGELLLGQKPSPFERDDYLSPGVFELALDPASGRIEQGPKLLLPEGTNLFDFVQADLNGDGETETVRIDEKQKLLVYDGALNLIWVSSASYGGSKRYFGPNWQPSQSGNSFDQLTDAQQSDRTLVFIPGRLDTKDITGDGRPEVVVSTNEVGISKYFPNIRSYDGGSVACLQWFGQGLAELWQTSNISGYVADYYFDDAAPAAESGEARVLNRLYVAQIPEDSLWNRLLPGGETSRILAYEMIVARGANVAGAE